MLLTPLGSLMIPAPATQLLVLLLFLTFCFNTMRTISIFSLIVSLLFLSGCGERLPDGMPKPHPVTIQVVSEGNPVEGASVMLFPEDVTSRWGGGGVSDSSGNVVIRTLGQFNGAPAGRYKVMISKLEITESTDPRVLRSGDPNDYFDLIDPKLSNIENPVIWVEVVPGRNVFVQEVGPLVRILQRNR